MSSGYACRRRPAICSGEQPSARCDRTYCHSQGSQEFPRSSRLTGSDGRLGVTGGGPIGTAPRGVARRLAAHGAGGSAPTPWPSFAANGRGPISNSRSELGLKLLLNQQCENCEQHKAIVVKEQWKRCQSEAGRLGSERTWAFVSS